MRRVALPPGGSILITSAPRPASSRPVYSARSSAISITRSPANMPGPALPSIGPGPDPMPACRIVFSSVMAYFLLGASKSQGRVRASISSSQGLTISGDS